MNDVKATTEAYMEAIKKRVNAAQESGDIPTEFVYSHDGHTWLMTLPQSVMAQKHLLHARDDFLQDSSFENEERFLRLIAPNVRKDGAPVNLELLDIGSIEIMKTAYMDCLLLPLSLGGDKKLADYMKMAAANVA